MASVGSLNPFTNAFKKKSFKDSDKNFTNKSQKLKFGISNKEQQRTEQLASVYRQEDKIVMPIAKESKRMIPRLTQEQNIKTGPLLIERDPSSIGFRNFSHKDRELPRYLIQQSPIITSTNFTKDPWDAANQKKMLSLENSISDVTELWEALKKIRDVERKIMEQKGLVDRADLAKDLNDAIVFQGTCEDMCPIFERARRSVENNVVRYEKDNPTDKKISRFKAIKVFARPAAAAAPPLPSDVRPPHVLVKTLDYIVANIVQLLPDCESFLWDRMRSIRQDFTYQNYSGPEAVDCNERIVRIHLLILHVMAKADIEYSRQQELEQLNKALITLSEIYDEVRIRGGSCPNEAEFRAYAFLSKIRDPEYDKMIQGLPRHIFHDEIVQLAICFRRIISNTSYIERGHVKTENCLHLYRRFFQLIKSPNVPFLMSSFLEVYVNEIRFYAIKSLSMTVSKKHKNIPFSYFLEELLFNDLDELTTFCNYYAIGMYENGISLKSLKYHSHLITERKPLKQACLKCVEDKLKRTTYIDLINSGKPNNDILGIHVNGTMSKLPAVEINPDFEHKSMTPSPMCANVFNKGNIMASNGSANNPILQSQVVHAAGKKDDAIRHSNKPPNDINVTVSTLFSTPATPIVPPRLGSFTAYVQGSKNTIQEVNINESKKKNEEFKKSNELKLMRNQAPLRIQDFNLKSNISEESIKTETKTPNIPTEPKKKKQLPILQISDNLIRSIVNDKVSDVIKDEFDNIAKRERRLKTLSNDLFKAFIHETLFFIYSETRADLFHEKNVLKSCITAWKLQYEARKSERELKKKRKEELLQVGKQLGIPVLKRPRTSDVNNSSASAFHGNSSFLRTPRTWIDTPVAPETNHFNTPVRKNTLLWQPIDLVRNYCSMIAAHNEDVDHSVLSDGFSGCKNELSLYVYARTWSSVSGSWLLNKFSLNSQPRFDVSTSDFKLSVVKLGNDYHPSDFKHLQLLIFNTGVTDLDIYDLEMRLKQDGEKLVELVHGISLNTDYKFCILLVYWSSTGSHWSDRDIAKYLKLNTIRKLFGSVIQSIEIAMMNNDRPDETLVKSLVTIADKFKFQLTERGEYNKSILKRNLAGAGGSAISNFPEPSNTIDERLNKALQLEKQKHENYKSKKSLYAHLQNHISASPKFKVKKLPVLLSEKNKGKFKTPMNVLPHRKSLSESPMASLPSQSSHLAAKIKHLPVPIATYGTPSQVRPQHHSSHNKWLLQTPSVAVAGSSGVPITGTANTSGLSNITFAPLLMTPIEKIILETPPPNKLRKLPDKTGSFKAQLDTSKANAITSTDAPALSMENRQSYKPRPYDALNASVNESDSMQELRGLIASVKDKLKR
ncbi:HBR088Wp [Eremothecium sinecaudum]|uniref:Nuclear mRNA export factor n=1 Tax=Eremothecium sinecaudum TaxID=45286 RepID=A0A120K141_9SACH|nr:HBR088Wp [Eremothecium sinecaudum]AMD18989.1 HBR088Wp [Eremothecium sinecaudum]